MRQSRQIIALILGAGMLCACGTSDADKTDLQRGYASYAARDLDNAQATATRFINANPASPNIDEAYYLRGVSRYSRGTAQDRRLAAEDLRAALDKSQHPDLKAKALRLLGDIDFESQQWDQAQDYYQKALQLWPAPSAQPAASGGGGQTYINYRIGACLQGQGKWEEAQSWFERVLVSQDEPFLRERAVARVGLHSYALQFGAFQDPKLASDLKAQLKAANINADSIAEVSDGKLWYRVRAGTYKTWAAAAAARDSMIAKYQMVTIIP